MPYDSHIRKIFGDSHVQQLNDSKVLLVGAGGIGCELLKDLILMNYGEIHVLDLDTIDLSNLNRQFLFRQKDIKKPKSTTAIDAVQFFNHGSKLIAYNGNIMDTKTFPLSFFQQFNIIFNALDNLEARLYVNKIALFTGVPLMESGTTGLKGQVQPIYPYKTECFACLPKATPKTFPVCTIRSTPSKPIHCITWAKNFLFPQLFGENDVSAGSSSDDDKLKEESDNKDEVEALLKETNELLELKRLIQRAAESPSDDDTYIHKILSKIYKDDIERLLMIETLWTSREKPTPLSYSMTSTNTSNILLSDQKRWTKQENISVFVDSLKRMVKRIPNEKYIEFDKDDEDTLDFIVSSSNLRSFVFSIDLKTKFEIKQIAGNIIPAVATTNAIMAGFSALSSIHIFEDTPVENSRMVYDSSNSSKFINTTKLVKPIESCKACSITRGILKTPSLDTITINRLRTELIKKYGYSDDIEISTSDSRLIYDYDFEDNLEKSLADFSSSGDILLISDSDEVLDHIELYLDETAGATQLELPDLTIPPYRTKKVEEDSPDEDEDDLIADDDQQKDGVIVLDDDEDDIQVVGDGSKKRKFDGEASAIANGSSSKKQKVAEEEDDIVVLD